jgi:hypothetical protein
VHCLLLLLLLPPLQDLAEHSGRLPERLALGCGTREYSATREHERYDVDQLLLNVSDICCCTAVPASGW